MALYFQSQGVTFEQMTNPFVAMSLMPRLPKNWAGYMFLLNTVVWSVIVEIGRRVLLAIWPDPQATAPGPVELPL